MVTSRIRKSLKVVIQLQFDYDYSINMLIESLLWSGQGLNKLQKIKIAFGMNREIIFQSVWSSSCHATFTG